MNCYIELKAYVFIDIVARRNDEIRDTASTALDRLPCQSVRAVIGEVSIDRTYGQTVAYNRLIFLKLLLRFGITQAVNIGSYGVRHRGNDCLMSADHVKN